MSTPKIEDTRTVVEGKQTMTPSEAFVETLVANGVTDMFGIMGSAFMDAMDIFAPAGIRLIPVVHEQGAAHMADGYSRVSGRHGTVIGLPILWPIGYGLVKSVVFAWIIGTTACHTGLTIRGGASAVGRATTKAVVTGIFLIIVADSLFATISTLLQYE